MIRVLVALLALSSSAQAAQDYCPEGLPYYFTQFREFLLISRVNHTAFCTPLEGNVYECMEKWPADEVPSTYTVKAKINGDGDLLFTNDATGDWWPAIGECK
ncbi:hypothetical protein AB1P65_09550 [Roseibium alexandrii]